MSTVITGTPNNVTTPLSATVSAITNNGGQSEVQTAAPHLFGDGDYVNVQVTILGVPLTFYYFITVVDSTHFILNGSTFVATGTGTAYDLSLSPQIQFPTDADSFSLQISGMLSGLQALSDRTQYLRYLMTQRQMLLTSVSATSTIAIPPWATHILVDGCGGGGGGGGGPGGIEGDANQQYAAGGGGSGSLRAQSLVPIPASTSAIGIIIGAGGSNGAGSAGGLSPANASPGGDGGTTIIYWANGPDIDSIAAEFLGGSGGGGGLTSINATASNVPVFTPGGRGPAGQLRSGPAGLLTQYAPGARQLINLYNSSGTITAIGSWPVSVYTDPVGQMDYQEGGASVANSNNSTYAAALSYNGGSSPTGYSNGGIGGGGPYGGAAGSNGAADGIWPGGAGGGGGGAGGFGPGGHGGNGGTGSHAGAGGNGNIGQNAGNNTGAGGGGGGGGGNGDTGGGAGLSGGAGGTGFVNITFLAFPALP